MMLARNNLEREFEKAKRAHREEKAKLEERLGELEKFSVIDLDISKRTISPLLSPKLKAISTDRTPAAIDRYSNRSPSVVDRSKGDTEGELLRETNNTLTNRLKDANEEIFTLTAELKLVRSQHSREVQDLKMLTQKSIKSDTYNNLQNELEAEQQRCRELEQALRVQADSENKLLLGK